MKHIKKFEQIFESKKEDSNGYYLIITNPSDRKFFEGERMEDRSRLLVPFNSKQSMFMQHDTKPVIYRTMEAAEDIKEKLSRRYTDATIEVVSL